MLFNVKNYFLCFCLVLITQVAYAGHGGGANVGIEEVQAGQGTKPFPIQLLMCTIPVNWKMARFSIRVRGVASHFDSR